MRADVGILESEIRLLAPEHRTLRIPGRGKPSLVFTSGLHLLWRGFFFVQHHAERGCGMALRPACGRKSSLNWAGDCARLVGLTAGVRV